LGERVSRLDGIVDAQADMIANQETRIAKAEQTVLGVPLMQNETDTLRQAVKDKDATIETLRIKLTASERKADVLFWSMPAIAILMLVFNLFLFVFVDMWRRSRTVPIQKNE
ncbi:MAG: hypothetical protein Greene07144_1104, partial [Parcubacteria group bacterium Greene0714_4]